MAWEIRYDRDPLAGKRWLTLKEFRVRWWQQMREATRRYRAEEMKKQAAAEEQARLNPVPAKRGRKKPADPRQRNIA